jgi:hypothetical protein
LKKILYAPESAYVQNWSGYSENPCDIEDIQVEEVTELPENLE